MGGGNPGSPLGTRSVERFLRRVYALAGFPPATEVRGDVAPSIECRPIYPEDFYDFGYMLGAGVAVQGAGGAGRFSYSEIAAAGANFLTVARVRSDTAAAIVFQASAAQGGLNLANWTPRPRDSRWAWNPAGFFVPLAQASQGDTAGGTGTVTERIFTAGNWSQWYVLAPSPTAATWMAVYNATANAAVTFTWEFVWVPLDASTA